jgi:membrane protease YdiL (CAAX protease family)
MSRGKVVGLAFAFVVLSLLVRLGIAMALIGAFGESSAIARLVGGVVVLAIVIALTVFLRRRWSTIERPDLVVVPRAFKPTLRFGFAGLGAGFMLYGAVFAIAHSTGGIQIFWQGNTAAAVRIAGLLLAIAIVEASWEEFTFRGWPFSICAQAFGPHAAAIFVGVAFAAAHMLNPQSSFAAIGSVSLAGWLLGYAMLASKNITLPIGLHAGWNALQAFLASPALWFVAPHPDPRLSGGTWGLEASAAGVLVTASAVALALAAFLRTERLGK